MNPTTTLPSVPDAIDAVEQCASEARQAYERSVADERAAYESRAIEAFEKHEAQRRAQIIKQWKSDNPWKYEVPKYKYDGWKPEAIYRDSLPAESRIDSLLSAGLYDQALRCFLVRHSRDASATIEECQNFLEPYIEVRGDCLIVPNDHERADLIRNGREHMHTFADGLSPQLRDLLVGSMITVWLGVVKFDWRYDHPDRGSW